MHMSPGILSLLQPLEGTIRLKFLPSILGREIGDLEHNILTLPVQMGGLGIINPVKLAPEQFSSFCLDFTISF